MWKGIGLEEPVASPQLDHSSSCQGKGNQQDRKRVWQCNRLKFRTDFDSGNLADVIPCTKEGEYELWIRPDCSGQPFQTKHRTWFYFGLSGHEADQVLSFHVVNMNKQAKLYSFDMRPAFYTPGVSGQWEPTLEAVKHEMVASGFKLSFTHRFTSAKETFFAFCIPFSYTDNERLMSIVEKHAGARDDLYFCREALGFSKHGRTIDLITISSKDGMLDSSETTTSYPCVDLGREKVRAFDPSKKVFVVSSRVHPGETPATHVFNGFLSFLLQKDDERAIKLREKFVFKLVPIINPDGVSFGHYRSDSQGQNLNRFYEDPKPEIHPEIFALKSLIMYYFGKGTLEVSIDLHAHANRMGSFAYGNHLSSEQQMETILYNKLVAMNCPYYDFRSCSFSERNMSSKDKNGESKEGSNRVALYRATNLVHIYTIETNYSCASLTTAVTDAADSTKTISPGYKVQSRKKFTVDSFGQIGKALLVGMLDVKEWNPYSRLKSSEFKNMQVLRNWASSYVNASLLSKKFKSLSSMSPKGSRRSSVSAAVVAEEPPKPANPGRRSVSSFSAAKAATKERKSIFVQNKEKIRAMSLQNRERRRSIALQHGEDEAAKKGLRGKSEPYSEKVRVQVQKLEVETIETNENLEKSIRWF
ncbi:putative zinc carboxypeptidase [Chloropicon primus]|uniref:Cytosolic carboxypeptidase-like protein 5 n=1 Tax=Chloropicon primus TaxID=1764295 RepID=A0A5B8MFA5_9CHLO|nr:putative zinc carboxypeptidase [Chloropicon primus]UPQ98364.1 putative zinc carboxypeptidase [Chloropicon primus]|eukprot:QDZ19156.1 putative zinc carboxypeptidase [Chloropicon primus]